MRKLDPFQARAVQQILEGKKHLRLLATAGAGKTTTLTEAIGKLLEMGVPPQEILATTFTKSAGEELKKRLVQRHARGESCLVGTFHSIGLRALRAIEPEKWEIDRCLDANGAKVPKTRELWTAILDWAKNGIPGLPGSKSLSVPEAKNLLGDYILEIEILRSAGFELLTPQGEVDEEAHQAALAAEKHANLPKLADAWLLYSKAKHQLQAFDFQDVMTAWLRKIRELEIIPSFSYVFVDEGQDNSKIQLDLAVALALNGKLILIGDASQSIYAFRGAVPDVFCSLPMENLLLPYNYRSSGVIVEAGNRLTAPLSTRLEAKVGRAVLGELRALSAPDSLHEARLVAEEIQNYLHDGKSPDDFAILVRTQSAAGLFEGELTRRSIPVSREGGIPFWERWDVLVFIGYAVLYEFDSFPALERIYNTPSRYLSRDWLRRVGEAVNRGVPLLQAAKQEAAGLNATSRDRAYSFVDTLIKRRTLSFSDAMDDIALLLTRAYKDSQRDISDDKSAIPQTVAAVAKDLGSVQALVKHADQTALRIRRLQEMKSTTPRVTITTAHRAKAREWKQVYCSMPSGVFPHRRATTPERQEEERRLAYVAVTRAQEVLVISWPEFDASGRRIGPGMFVEEIFREAP